MIIASSTWETNIGQFNFNVTVPFLQINQCGCFLITVYAILALSLTHLKKIIIPYI